MTLHEALTRIATHSIQQHAHTQLQASITLQEAQTIAEDYNARNRTPECAYPFTKIALHRAGHYPPGRRTMPTFRNTIFNL